MDFGSSAVNKAGVVSQHGFDVVESRPLDALLARSAEGIELAAAKLREVLVRIRGHGVPEDESKSDRPFSVLDRMSLLERDIASVCGLASELIELI